MTNTIKAEEGNLCKCGHRLYYRILPHGDWKCGGCWNEREAATVWRMERQFKVEWLQVTDNHLLIHRPTGKMVGFMGERY